MHIIYNDNYVYCTTVVIDVAAITGLISPRPGSIIMTISAGKDVRSIVLRFDHAEHCADAFSQVVKMRKLADYTRPGHIRIDRDCGVLNLDYFMKKTKARVVE